MTGYTACRNIPLLVPGECAPAPKPRMSGCRHFFPEKAPQRQSPVCPVADTSFRGMRPSAKAPYVRLQTRSRLEFVVAVHRDSKYESQVPTTHYSLQQTYGSWRDAFRAKPDVSATGHTGHGGDAFRAKPDVSATGHTGHGRDAFRAKPDMPATGHTSHGGDAFRAKPDVSATGHAGLGGDAFRAKTDVSATGHAGLGRGRLPSETGCICNRTYGSWRDAFRAKPDVFATGHAGLGRGRLPEQKYLFVRLDRGETA